MKRFVWSVLSILLLLSVGVLKTTNEARAATFTDETDMTIGFYGVYPINPPETINKPDKNGNNQLIIYDVPQGHHNSGMERLPQTSEKTASRGSIILGLFLLLISERLINIKRK